MSLANGIGDPKSKISMSVKYDANGRATVRESRQMSGSFFEFMELNQFPFDRQVWNAGKIDSVISDPRSCTV